MNGDLSAFGLITRDTLPNPSIGPGEDGTNSSLDAAYVNRAADALVRLQDWNLNAVRLEDGTAAAPGFSVAVQRWLVEYLGGDTRGDAFSVLLPLSPAFLEDSGAVPTQAASPSDPSVSLAASLSLGTTRFTPHIVSGVPTDLEGLEGIECGLPSWCGHLAASTRLSGVVLLLGATGQQCCGLEDLSFFDAGSGSSPRLSGTVRFRTPALRTTTLPPGHYEITLCAMDWIP